MEQISSRVVIIETYRAQYGDPIAFRAGETVDVQHADPDFSEWFWCRGPDGKQGSVHFSYLSQTTGQATAVRDYSAQELTIAAGDEALIRTLGGWAYLALNDGRFGWVPDNIIRARVSPSDAANPPQAGRHEKQKVEAKARSSVCRSFNRRTFARSACGGPSRRRDWLPSNRARLARACIR
jgi:hypothetical protein